jgi:hypothetical protein
MIVMPLRPDPAPTTKRPAPEPAKPEERKFETSQPTTETTTNERKTMPRTATRIQTPVNNDQTTNGEQNSGDGSVMKSLAEKVERRYAGSQ